MADYGFRAIYYPVLVATGELADADACTCNIYWCADHSYWNGTVFVAPPGTTVPMTQQGDHWVYDFRGGEDGVYYQVRCVSTLGPLDPAPSIAVLPATKWAEPSDLLAVQIAQYLHDQGIGVFDPEGSSGNIFIDHMPDTPDEAIAIRQTGGGRVDMRVPFHQPTAQILIRGTADPRVAGATAAAAYDVMHGLTNGELTAGGVWIVKCQAITPPACLGPDENGRHHYSINFELITRRD